MWDPYGSMSSWCIPGASLVACEFSASLSSSSMPTCPVHSYRSTVLLHNRCSTGKEVSFFRHKSGDCPNFWGLCHSSSMIFFVILTYTQSHNPNCKIARTEAELCLAEGIQETYGTWPVDPNAPAPWRHMTRLPKNGKTGSASAASLRKL